MDTYRQVHRLVTGYQASQAVHVAAALRLSDLLADGPKSVAELAEDAGADAPSLRRLMRVLVVLGLYVEADDGRYANTALGEVFRTDATPSAADWARLVGRPFHWQAYGGLVDSVRTGRNAFESVHGMALWDYLSEHADEQQVFDDAMTAVSRAMAQAVVDAYDFGQFGTVVDVGGGRGMLLAAILARCPAVEGVLFDRPQVVAGADDLLSAAGVATRCRTVGGSFFDAVPAGGDAYVLKAVIHDWPDHESIEILRTCRRAVPPYGRLLLVEQLPDQAPDPVRTALADLTMLVVAGGQERTTDEYGALLASSGFTLTRSIPTATDVFVLEATPAQ